MFDEYLKPPRVEIPISPALAVSTPVNSAGTPLSTTIDQDAPSPSHSPSSSALQSLSLHQGVAADTTLMEDNPFAPVDNDHFINIFALEPRFEASSGDLSSTESPYVSQTLHHLGKWSKDHPLDNIIGNPCQPVSTRKQLGTDALWCLYNFVWSKVEPKNFKSATKKSKPLAPKAPSLAKRSKAGKVTKKRKPKSSLQLIDEGVDEGVPDKEPLYGDEEADTQRAIEESLKEVHGAHRGPLPPVVFREPDSGKFQPLPEVQGKGKEKVRVEQAAQVLLNLQTPKKKSPADQYIFQRRTSTQTEPSGHDESSSLYAELGLTDSETDSDEEVSGIVARVQDEGQAGPNLEHMDLEASDTSIQPNPEQMDEEFTTTAYPNVQENLKLPTKGEVRLKEPASSAGTLSSL
ncbi:hypothetical protein Tco_0173886 [Tanacetum coccineum]